MLYVGAGQHFAARGFDLGHHFGRTVQLVFKCLVHRELLVDQLFKHFLAHRLGRLGRGIGGVGAAQNLVDLVYRYFLRAHLDRDLGRDFFVVLVAAGGQGEGEEGCGQPITSARAAGKNGDFKLVQLHEGYWLDVRRQ